MALYKRLLFTGASILRSSNRMELSSFITRSKTDETTTILNKGEIFNCISLCNYRVVVTGRGFESLWQSILCLVKFPFKRTRTSI